MATTTQVRVYNGDEVTVAFGPVLIDSGYGPDEFVRVEPEGPSVEDEAGTDGEVLVTRTNDRRATITITLLQSAAANTGLSVLANLAENAPGMAGAIHPAAVRDQNGTSLHAAANAWIREQPAVAYARAAGTREWQIRAAHMRHFNGSNNLAG